jgi:prevent-host-death family protein
MATSTISAREFNQHVSRAKKAAQDGPVIITERGKPAYVLMRHEEFAKAAEQAKKPWNALEALSDPNAANEEVVFPRLNINLRNIDFS